MAKGRVPQGRPQRSGVYVDGNTVRKIEPARRPVKKQTSGTTPYVNERQIRKNQERALYIDFPYVLMLTVAAICSLVICVQYLHQQSVMQTRLAEIEALEQKVETLKTENDTLETRINTSVSLDHVYQVATEELGMVYAGKDQVLLYDKTESEYVRQNEDIPKYK